MKNIIKIILESIILLLTIILFLLLSALGIEIINFKNQPEIIYLEKKCSKSEIIYLDEKKNECVKAGGEYRISDYSWEDDGSDYRAICEIPEQKLWEIKL